MRDRSAGREIRVLQLVAGCQVGGLEVVTLSLVRRLQGEFAFRVVCYDSLGPLEDRYEALGVGVELVPRRGGVDLRYPFELARVIRRESIDVLHAHNNTALFYGVLASVIAGGRRVVFTAHDRAVPRLRLRVLQRLLGKVTTYAIAVSEIGRRNLLRVDGFDPERVRVVYNGADERAFEHEVGRDEARDALGLPREALVVGTVARLHAEKNVPLLVRAFGRIAASRPDALLVIAGDGPERAQCEEAARSAGIEDRLRLLGTRDDVARVLAAFDVFALSSSTEGLPVAVLEAMGAARPVVSTDVGAVREVVREGVSGFLVPPGDEAALAARLDELLAAPERAREMGRAGALEFRDRFTLGRMAAAYGRVYRDAVEGGMS